MINLNVINGTIAELEDKEMTYANIEKLAWLYTVRENIQLKNNEYSTKISSDRDTDFIRCCKLANNEMLWNTLDDLMSTLEVLYPKLYETVLSQIRNN